MTRTLRTIFLAFLVVSPLVLFSQNRLLSIDSAVMGGYSYLNPENLSGLQWIKNTNDYSYHDFNGRTLLKGNAVKEGNETLLQISDLNNALQTIDADTLKSFSGIKWLSDNKFVFENKNKYYSYDLDAKKAAMVNIMPREAANPDLHYKTLNVAYTLDNNLLIATPTGDIIQVSNEADKGIVYGQSAHRNEFGIEKGTFWSPTGDKLAFYRQDETMVTGYPIIDISPLPAGVNMIKYPMAGGKSHHVTVGVCNVSNGSVIYLQTGPPEEQYLTNISWSPDAKQIYIAVLNREQNHLKLNKYDAADGHFIKTLFEEKHPKYVEPLDPLIFIKNQPDKFLWLSQRDGHKHFYLYDTEGKLIKQLSSGNWDVTDFLGFDEAGKNIFYMSTAESPLEQHPYSLSIQGGAPKKLSSSPGMHRVQLNDMGTYIIDNYSNPTTPREILIADAYGKKIRVLLKADNPLKEFKLGKTSIVELKADDGAKLYGRLITPPDMAAGKKYPVVVYVYGGPHLQLVTNSWLAGSNLWMQYMAQHGYIVFSLDNRGSYNRGRDFEQAVFRHLGTVELQDQLKGVEYLKSLPNVDTARMGIHGWSFGGFMTTSMMLRNPGVFKVAVAGGPVIDWKYYEIMYTERYMDTPQENPDGYEEANLLNKVDKLDGRLMLIHGTMDDVVVWQHSLAFVKKAVDEKKLIDYFVYPGHPHNVHGVDRVHLMRKITQYFDDFLK